MSSSGRLLSLSRNLLARNGISSKEPLAQSSRMNHTVCVPPRNRIPFSEKVVYGIILSLSMWIAPAYIMYHVPDYQKEKRHTYTGK